MSLIIRRALLSDAPQIAAVKTRVWSQEETTEAQIQQALRQPGHAAFVAAAGDKGNDDEVVGFIDSFPTVGAGGVLRWEVDLLAVDAAWQGQGIGRELITAATSAGAQAGAALARALIQTENIPSQRAFRRCQYTPEAPVYQLMISTAAPADTAPLLLDDAQVINVTTMNYSGLWLEGARTASHLRAAQAEQARRGAALVGALLPVQDPALLEAAARCGYQPVAQFQWWVLPLG